VLQRLSREAGPAITPLLLDRLTADEAEIVRLNAAYSLRQRLDEPGVRFAFERAASVDSSEAVRSAAQSVLTAPN
jgi:HEAT repeat protein